MDGANGFERSYTLAGSAAMHEPEAIRRLILQLIPTRSACSWTNTEVNTSQHIGFPTREPQMGQAAHENRLDEHMRRALNKIRKPSTAEEITEVLNRDLDPGDPPSSERLVGMRLTE